MGRLKTCGGCSLDLPIEAFGLNGKNRAGDVAYKPRCRPCDQLYRFNRYGIRPRPAYVASLDSRERARAHYKANREQIRAYQRAYYAANKERLNAASRLRLERDESLRVRRREAANRHRAAYRGEVNRRAKEKRQALSPEQREIIRANDRARYAAKMQRADERTRRLLANSTYYAQNKSKATARSKEWRKANRMKVREYSHRHAALKRDAAVGDVSYDRILARDGMECYLCDSAIGESDLSFDHVIPLSRGGSHSEDNIRPVHLVCNCRKQDKLLHEIPWLKLVA